MARYDGTKGDFSLDMNLYFTTTSHLRLKTLEPVGGRKCYYFFMCLCVTVLNAKICNMICDVLDTADNTNHEKRSVAERLFI